VKVVRFLLEKNCYILFKINVPDFHNCFMTVSKEMIDKSKYVNTYCRYIVC